jgi:hypothetical protein
MNEIYSGEITDKNILLFTAERLAAYSFRDTSYSTFIATIYV